MFEEEESIKEESMVLAEVFGSDFAMDTVCEDFYRVFKEYLSTQVDKNGDGIIDSDEAEDKPLPDIMTASLMYSSLDLDGDGEVTHGLLDRRNPWVNHDEASHCLIQFTNASWTSRGCLNRIRKWPFSLKKPCFPN